MKDETKDNIKFAMSVVLLIAGIVMAFVSLYLPPQGVIDSSVLMLIGETFTFIGAVWGISSYTGVQIKKIETQANRSIEND